MKKKEQYTQTNCRKTDMDCSVCKKQKECDSRAEGKFCDSFRSATFIPGKRKPLKVWEEERKARQAVKKQ